MQIQEFKFQVHDMSSYTTDPVCHQLLLHVRNINQLHAFTYNETQHSHFRDVFYVIVTVTLERECRHYTAANAEVNAMISEDTNETDTVIYTSVMRYHWSFRAFMTSAGGRTIQ